WRSRTSSPSRGRSCRSTTRSPSQRRRFTTRTRSAGNWRSVERWKRCSRTRGRSWRSWRRRSSARERTSVCWPRDWRGRLRAVTWYAEWFGEAYLELYAHRDEDEARRQVAFFQRECGAIAQPVLDLACGMGRHMQELQALGYHAI